MKNEDKKRENSIDEAISPPFPQVQCISIAPETELQKGERMRRKRKGKVRNNRRKMLEEKKTREK